MKSRTVIERILLLITALLASYQVVQGIDGMENMAVACYTIAFGVLIVASLLIIILGFEILDSPLVVIVSSLIPLSLALGLVSQYLRPYLILYGIFIIAGFLGIVITRYIGPKILAVSLLALVHGVAGLTIFFLPFILAFNDIVPVGFIWVGIGSMLIGIGGLLLSFLRAGKPILSREIILQVFPGLLLLTTTAFVIGFSYV